MKSKILLIILLIFSGLALAQNSDKAGNQNDLPWKAFQKTKEAFRVLIVGDSTGIAASSFGGQTITTSTAGDSLTLPGTYWTWFSLYTLGATDTVIWSTHSSYPTTDNNTLNPSIIFNCKNNLLISGSPKLYFKAKSGTPKLYINTQGF